MRFFGNNKPQRGLPRRVLGEEELAEKKRLMLMLIANTVLILTLYFVLNQLEFWPIFFIYMGVAAVLVLVYAIYNRGFVYKGATPEMLSDTIPYEERVRIIEEAAARMKKTRWMLTFIIPFLLAFMLDALYLFLLGDLLASLGLVEATMLLPIGF